MGKLARAKLSAAFRGPAKRWMEQTKIVNISTTVYQPYGKGGRNFGQTFQTLAEVISSQALQDCSVRLQNSASAPTLLLESSTSRCSAAGAAPCSACSPREHPRACSCRWPERPDRGSAASGYDSVCTCKKYKKNEHERSKQPTAGTSRTCLNNSCKRERSVPCMKTASLADASVQLLYYRDKLTATEQLVEQKDEIIRLQHESLALAERRLASLTAARVELRRAGGAAHAHAPPAQNAKQQQALVDTLQSNLSVMEELYRESFYEVAKQDGIIENLRISCFELREIDASKAGEVERLQNVVNKQECSLDQAQDMASQVEQLKSEIYSLVNVNNDDSGVWVGEESSPPALDDDLKQIKEQLITLKDVLLAENTCSAEDETMKLQEKNVQLQDKISHLQSHVSELRAALAQRDRADEPAHGTAERAGRCARAPRPAPATRARAQCHDAQLVADNHSSLREHVSQLATLEQRTRISSDENFQDEGAQAQVRGCDVCAAAVSTCSQRARCPLTLLQAQVSSAQARSAALCLEARRALARVRRWALRMRARLKEREAEIERQKQEIEELRRYINNLKECSLAAAPESKALSERYAMKKRKLEEEKLQCQALRREIEKIKEPVEFKSKASQLTVDDEEMMALDEGCEEEVEDEQRSRGTSPPPQPCPRDCPKLKAYQAPVDHAEMEKKTRHKARHRPPREEEPPPKQRDKQNTEPRLLEPNSSCYEILPGEIAEVDACPGQKVLVKCRDCERAKLFEEQQAAAQHGQRADPRVTTYEEEEKAKCCNDELCILPKKKDDKCCNESVSVIPKSEGKKRYRDESNLDRSRLPSSSKNPNSPGKHHPCSCSSRDTFVCQSNDSLRSLRFKEPPVDMSIPCEPPPLRICTSKGSLGPERQQSLIRTYGSKESLRIEVPVTINCPPTCTSTGTAPDKKKDKRKLKIPKIDMKPTKKQVKESKKSKRREEVPEKKCRCTGPCRCRCSTQAWKMEALSCSSCCSVTSRDECCGARAHPANSVDSYHSLLMGHLKKKFPFLAQRELIGTERKRHRSQRAPSETSGQVSTL